MDPTTLGVLVIGGGALAIVVWLLHKLGRALATVLEALAAVAVVFLALWWLLRAAVCLARQVVTRWRTSLVVVAVLAWYALLGWLSLMLAVGSVALALGAWWLVDAVSFDLWCGRWLRSWWMRWFLYHRKLPSWLHACGLSISDGTLPLEVT